MFQTIQFDVNVMALLLVSNLLLWEYCYFAQQYENECDLLYLTLNDLPWYNWDIRNQKILHMILMNTQHALAIKSIGSHSANNQIITMTYREVYAFVTFFCTVTRRT
ncbi:uncharacterized protein LOC108908827 [Anoplophora glabripennis]|uniref:uncharacterized protein LOC108908827 n=1 Tax=Anoplophora glabripennis TaxID=217634 RepID=UPI000873F130|nr:uncharacterized protein LOC108908827 [Anoplophora glabripennis]